MTEGDILKVRGALIELTPQYQIDRNNFFKSIDALKESYPSLNSQITGYGQCYDSYQEQDPCLEAVQLGKAHLPVSKPLTDKEIFFRGMYPKLKKPDEIKALKELIQFSDEHGLAYSEYFTLLDNAIQKFGLTDGANFEADLKDIDPRSFLLQCILSAAMKALSKTPALTSVQVAKMPKGLQAYYKEYERTVLEHLANWDIMPRFVNRPSIDGSTFVSGAYAQYDPQINSVITYSDTPFLSLNNFSELDVIYHELFHAYQDSKSGTAMSEVYIEMHAGLMGCISVLRLIGKKQTFESVKNNVMTSLREKAAQVLPPDISADAPIYMVETERVLKLRENFWDWAGVITRAEEVKASLSAEVIQIEIATQGITQYGLISMQAQNESFFSSFNRRNLTTLEEKIQENEEIIKEICAVLGVDISASDRELQVLAKFKEIGKKLFKDDFDFKNRMDTLQNECQAYYKYVVYSSRKCSLLYFKMKIFKENSPEREEATREYQDYKKNIFQTSISEMAGLFAYGENNGY